MYKEGLSGSYNTTTLQKKIEDGGIDNSRSDMGQPKGAHDAYKMNDSVYYPDKNGNIYISTIDNNVWSPIDYGWVKKTMRKKLLTLSKSNALIFKVDTTKAGISDSYSFRIPTIGGGYNYTVDWGDGFVNTGVTGNITHTYSTQGIKIIKITGVFPSFYFANSGDKLKLLNIINWGNITYSTVQNYAFWGCTNLTSIAYGEWLNTITNGDSMFRDCTSLTTLPSSITFASLTNGESMFRNCTSLTTLPSSITFASLTNGSYMFNACASLTTLPSSITFGTIETGKQIGRAHV